MTQSWEVAGQGKVDEDDGFSLIKDRPDPVTDSVSYELTVAPDGKQSWTQAGFGGVVVGTSQYQAFRTVPLGECVLADLTSSTTAEDNCSGVWTYNNTTGLQYDDDVTNVAQRLIDWEIIGGLTTDTFSVTTNFELRRDT